MSGQNQTIKVGLFGCGKWGKRVAQKLLGDSRYSLEFISTFSGKVPDDLKHIKKFNGWGTDLTNSVDLVYIATQPHRHIGLLKEAIIDKKSIICEKPCITNFQDFQIIDSLMYFGQHEKLFLTNFIYLFNDELLKTIDQIKQTNRGGSLYFNVKGPVVRPDTSVKLDYGSHVIAMAIYTLNTLGVETKNIDWDINNNGGKFTAGKYNGSFDWSTSSIKNVSVGFVDILGESIWWRDSDKQVDALQSVLNTAYDAITNNKMVEASNIQLTAETTFALDNAFTV